MRAQTGLLRQDCLVWTYLQLEKQKCANRCFEVLFCFELKYPVLAQGFFRPSSGSRQVGYLATHLESPEMTPKVSTSINCVIPMDITDLQIQNGQGSWASAKY